METPKWFWVLLILIIIVIVGAIVYCNKKQTALTTSDNSIFDQLPELNLPA